MVLLETEMKKVSVLPPIAIEMEDFPSGWKISTPHSKYPKIQITIQIYAEFSCK